ncbi:MAG: Diguanylate cyclase/phosphodiesterase domain 1 (GGDEF) [Candidatus Rifleibacterium amylolyticum]|nr:MAG: Diguanylate cyclase/phosphodiesterase domain 1 (GGDEF) [Candidatus Rifleibacterium amylolyticum]
MKRKLALLFLIVVVVPMFLAIYTTSRLVTSHLTDMLQKRARDSLAVAHNFFLDTLDEMALKVQILAQSKDIREAVRSGDIVELIDRVHLANRHLKLNAYDAVTEIYGRDATLLAGEPCTRYPLCPPAVVAEVLQGKIMSFREIVNGHLRICSAAPMYHENAAGPIGVVVISLFSTHQFAEEIKKIIGTDLIFFGFVDERCLLFGSTFREAGELLPVEICAAESRQPAFDKTLAGRGYLFQTMPLEAQNGRLFIATAVEKALVSEMIVLLGDNLIQIGVAAILFAILLALLFSRTLTRPINSLVASAQAIGAGDFESRIGVESHDEFAFLGKTMDDMRCEIKSTVDKLKAAKIKLDRQVFDLSLRNLINQAIIYQKESDLIKGILEILRETIQVRIAAMFMFDPISERMTLTTLDAAPEAGDRSAVAQLETGCGFAGKAVKSSGAIVCNNLAKEPAASLAVEPAWVQTGKNLLALPLSGDKGILGVLYLVDHPQGFVDDDVELLSDISIQIAIAIQKAQLHQLAITDGLTGLYIHRYFQLRLDAAIAKAKRREEPVSLILFDVDHFKKFNDTWGHQIGDRVLKKVAEITAATVREGIDLPARYGGEEFTVIMPNTPLEGAVHLAERIRTNVEQTILMHEDKPISVTISLGCATFPDHAADKEALIKTADEALYRSKQAGRNRTTPAG